MGAKYIIRTKDGMDHYIHGFWECVRFLMKNTGNMYYIRINFFD